MWRDAILFGFGISLGLMALVFILNKAIKLTPRIIKRETWEQRLRRELGFKEDQL
jgi:hypothetical protein